MKAVLIYNVLSGKGNVLKDLHKIETYFKVNQWELSLFEVKEGFNLCKDSMDLAYIYDTFLIAGGDGTIHSVINGVMSVPKDMRPKLLFLPYGTTNDCASMLGLGKNVFYNLALLKTDHFEKMDVYAANKEFFVYAAAIGKFSNVSYEINRRKLKWLGSIGYLLNARHDLRHHYHIDVKAETKELTIERKAFLIILAAGSKVGGFKLDNFTRNPKLNDGKIDARIFTRNHIFSWTKMVWFYIFRGRHFHNDIHLNTEQITFHLNDNFVWNIDGEKGPSGRLDVKVNNKELEVYVHPKYKQKLF